jgi:hypothetical protein
MTVLYMNKGQVNNELAELGRNLPLQRIFKIAVNAVSPSKS